MKTYELEDKYKGLEEYEWNTTQTRKDKEEERKRKALQAERQRLYREQEAIRA